MVSNILNIEETSITTKYNSLLRSNYFSAARDVTSRAFFSFFDSSEFKMFRNKAWLCGLFFVLVTRKLLLVCLIYYTPFCLLRETKERYRKAVGRDTKRCSLHRVYKIANPESVSRYSRQLFALRFRPVN